MTLFAEYGQVLFVLACVFGLFMAWGIGANDVSNAMGTSVGSRALTMKQAIIIAMVFEFAGAYLAGGEVTETIRSGIVDVAIMTNHPDLFVYGMLASLLAAGSWLLIASILGWPVSTTHSIVGAIIGFAAVGISVDAVQWGQVWGIVGSWVTSPLVSGIISFWIFRSVQYLILDTEDPFANAKRYIDLMRRETISWTNWNWSDDHRSGAVFVPGTCPNGDFAAKSSLKPAGVWMRKQIRKRD